jgi:archaellum component FlaC
MFDIDLLVAFAFMGILFLRQISIIKQPNKINYAPLMIGIGAISGTIHFIAHPEASQSLLVLKESLFPILVSLILYLIMNILHQTQQAQYAKEEHESTKELLAQFTQLKEFSGELEKRVILNQNDERVSEEHQRDKFKHDMKMLDSILENQNQFLENFEQMRGWYENVSKSFEKFTEVQLPSLDNVVHKHIDILRIAEQDHFNKVKGTLSKAIESREGIKNELEELKESLHAISNISQTIAKSITKHTTEQLSEVVKPFEKEIHSLKSHAEGVNTSLYESESKLHNIQERSELIMNQMNLSSKKMNELQAQNSSLHDIYAMMRDLMRDIEIIKSEYVKSQSQLTIIVEDFNEISKNDRAAYKEQSDNFLSLLNSEMQTLLQKLNAHKTEPEDVTSNLKFLSKQAQLKNRYSELES